MNSTLINGLGWRAGMVRRWTVGAASAFLIRLALILPPWAVPRWAMIPVERALLACWGSGLFDADFYLRGNPDVGEGGGRPLTHYLRHGWREGRAPNPHFDDGHYRALSGLQPAAPVSALAHFVAIGQHSDIAPVPAAARDALGPSAAGLEVARLDAYRGLVGGTIAPPEEGRPDLTDVRAALAEIQPRAPAWADSGDIVDILIPAYDGHAETLNTILHALRAANRKGGEISVIADAVPKPDLVADLRDLAARGLIKLIENAENLGFAASVNRGMALNPRRDVIWLNADTEVYDHWIDRLRSAAYSRGNVATVTPLTNNGTICSYPRADADNFGELGLPWRQIDRLAAGLNAGEAVESPTAVGFATYVRRAAIDRVGDLDAATFGRGYGEENDWCQRAIKAGWVNLLAADVLVRHFGATSFGGARAGRIAAAMNAMDRLHPSYQRDVDQFVAKDPLAPARRRLDLARLMAGRAGRPQRAALLITHSRGGGTAQHVHEETARLSASGWSVYVLTVGTGGMATAQLSRPGAGAMPSFANMDLDGDDLWSVLSELGLGQVVLHHLIDFAPSAPEVFHRRLTGLGLRYDVMIHDYFAICPRINLVDRHGRYCGEPGEAACQRCLTRRGSPVGRPDIADWRARHGALLMGARRVRVPDDDVGERLARYFPGLATLTTPHDLSIPPALRVRAAPDGEGFRIAVIGAIGPIKGFDAILGLARHVGARAQANRITIIGYTHHDAAARAAGIVVTGAYTNDRLPDLIAQADPHVIWIPSLWPETYCYTLSAALVSGRAIAAFDLGAQANRLRAAGHGTLIPLADAYRPAKLLTALHKAAGQSHLTAQRQVA